MVRKPNVKPRKTVKPKSDTTIITFKKSDIVQRWLVTTQGCPTCEEIKRDFKKEFRTGVLKATDVGDTTGFEIITALGIEEVPVFIVELRPDHPSGVRYLLDE